MDAKSVPHLDLCSSSYQPCVPCVGNRRWRVSPKGKIFGERRVYVGWLCEDVGLGLGR